MEFLQFFDLKKFQKKINFNVKTLPAFASDGVGVMAGNLDADRQPCFANKTP